MIPVNLPAPEPSSQKKRFLVNVVWSWIGVAVNLVLGIVLSPIIVRRLGVERYGVWVLLFSTMDYLRLLDFGFRSAVINRCARHKARHEWAEVNQTIATAVLYFLLIATPCFLLAFAGRDAAMDFFKIQPSLQNDARLLIVIIAFSISERLTVSPITGALEAFQRFDLINRAYIAALTTRAVGSIALLLSGHGLIGLAVLAVCVQIGEDLWNIISLKRVFPELRLSPRLVRVEALKGMFHYGKHSSVMAAANLISIQSPSTMLGYLRGPNDVAFFALPWRLLMYSTEAFAKVGYITSSVTAEFDEKRDSRNVWNMAVVTNRHCLALFMPLAVFLSLYGTPLLTVWVSPLFGRTSGPLLPVLAVPFLFAIAGQFNSGAVLVGQGRHALYAYGIVVEVISSIAAMFFVVPRYGAFGAACVVAVSLMVSRCLYLAAIMCRINGFSVYEYIDAIYTRALLCALPVIVVAALLRFTVLPGRNWFELIAAGAIIAGLYFSLAFVAVLDTASRKLILLRVPAFERMLGGLV
jgi:O-antigen/teichoic acid export membrane protein